MSNETVFRAELKNPEDFDLKKGLISQEWHEKIKELRPLLDDLELKDFKILDEFTKLKSAFVDRIYFTFEKIDGSDSIDDYRLYHFLIRSSPPKPCRKLDVSSPHSIESFIRQCHKKFFG